MSKIIEDWYTKPLTLPEKKDNIKPSKLLVKINWEDS